VSPFPVSFLAAKAMAFSAGQCRVTDFVDLDIFYTPDPLSRFKGVMDRNSFY